MDLDFLSNFRCCGGECGEYSSNFSCLCPLGSSFQLFLLTRYIYSFHLSQRFCPQDQKVSRGLGSLFSITPDDLCFGELISLFRLQEKGVQSFNPFQAIYASPIWPLQIISNYISLSTSHYSNCPTLNQCFRIEIEKLLLLNRELQDQICIQLSKLGL